MNSNSVIFELKSEIKLWERNFEKLNKRAPSKEDIKSDTKVYDLYKSYRKLKSGKSDHKTRTPTKEKVQDGEHRTHLQVIPNQNSSGNQSKESKNSTIIDQGAVVSSSDSENEETSKIFIENVELGPTPQADGRIVSIIDIGLTPPYSSPTAVANQVKPENDDDAFKTPTKPPSGVKLTGNLSRESNGKISLTQKLQNIANKPQTPTKQQSNSPDLTTPFYLAKNNSKFSLTPAQSDDNHQQTTPLSLQKRSAPMTPVKFPNLQFSVSPSPLKTQRFFTKKVSELFDDLKSIKDYGVDDDILKNEVAAETMSTPSEEKTHQGDQNNTRKSKTQKRTTRRWKIKPHDNSLVENSFGNKNVHKEIEKLHGKEVEQLRSYINSDPEEDQPSESDSETHSTFGSSCTDNKGKVKPTSQNFKRLKINDPRSKMFKRRR